MATLNNSNSYNYNSNNTNNTISNYCNNKPHTLRLGLGSPEALNKKDTRFPNVQLLQGDSQTPNPKKGTTGDLVGQGGLGSGSA